MKPVQKIPRLKLGFVFALLFLVFLQLWQSQSITKAPSALCKEMPSGNVTKRIPTFANHPLVLKGADHEGAAVCEFKPSHQSTHIPHAMQQLYQCWSYFQLNPDLPWILQRPNGTIGFPGAYWTPYELWRWLRGRHRTFSVGFVEALVAAANVTVTDQAKGVVRSDSADTFYMASPDHARALSSAVVETYNLSASAGCKRVPKIGILNRELSSSRTLLNAGLMADILRRELSGDVAIEYFEDKSFLEQVHFFVNTDILISPHGAQLTGIPFLPVCAAVLELFPSHYYFNEFFGSLSDAAGIASYSLYISRGDPDADWEHAKTLTSQGRRRYRNVQLCPPLQQVVEGVRNMVADWEACCEAHDFAIGNT